MIITKIQVRVDWSIVKFERIVVSSCLGSSKYSVFMGPLTLGLLTGYKMCPGLVFSSAVLRAVEKKEILPVFYLFFEVALIRSFESKKQNLKKVVRI